MTAPTQPGAVTRFMERAFSEVTLAQAREMVIAYSGAAAGGAASLLAYVGDASRGSGGGTFADLLVVPLGFACALAVSVGLVLRIRKRGAPQNRDDPDAPGGDEG